MSLRAQIVFRCIRQLKTDVDITDLHEAHWNKIDNKK